MIIFSPTNADGVGIFNPADDSFYLVDISAKLSGETNSAEPLRLPTA